ncbi:ABC transporter permease [Haloquadratum walsbyi]|jgi:putative ABC transport system permease protein|uniref:ABC-type antimicrobial peptide transport system permease protein n=3 Tax=Halobacteriales TaxID=2235 RepID=A5YSU7_9EURY|nr:ABC transporter permease [Haloquadratum walsbyi]ABQ76054.1 ABC-type antimicrobial peptide transport system permease protein [uncultured haloarchaeon]CAJ52146.2 ABC-type transport system permease protein (probable substrate macrolides) [Haloquadratum walsbyi DSM 16790]CCC40079.1 ABC-type transport system permease protein (probable substrate macrolides) [Haloquadratum walsbyi C23]
MLRKLFEQRFPAAVLAGQNLSRQRARAALAALGIVIGVFAVVTLGTLGTALQVAATAELGGLGNQVIISPSEESSNEALNSRDLQAIERAAASRGTVIPLQTTGTTASNGEAQTATQVYGTTTPKTLFNADDSIPEFHRQGAIVGADVASSLNVQQGSQVQVGPNSYRVIAILEAETGISPIQGNSAIILPPSAFTTSGYSQVVIKANSGGDATAIATEVRSRLNGRENRVSVFSLQSVLTQIEEFFGLLNGFLLAIASISLVVAGVSIFNIMLMTVSERRGEIGVLRAVGIHRQQVLRTLIIESTLLGVAGGFVGACGGVITVIAVGMNTQLPISAIFVPLNALIVFIGFGFGVIVALIGGLYPAYKAAWEPPVESLRG